MSIDEREALRRLVLPFRSVAGLLSDPAHSLLEALTLANEWEWLTPELPLVNFLPFEISIGGSDDQTKQPVSTQARVGQASILTTERVPPASLRPIADASSVASVSPAPVFSLRRPGVAGKATTPEKQPAARGPMADASTLPTAKPLAPGHPGEPRRPTAKESQPKANSQEQAAPGNVPAQQRRAPQAASLELLNQLAESILQRGENNRIGAAQGHTSAAPLAIPHSASRQTEASYVAQGNGVSRQDRAQSVELQEAQYEHPVGSLDPVAANLVSIPAYPGEGSRTKVVSTPPTENQMPPVQHADSSGRLETQLDADTIVALITDLLSEQARRHGVDLL